MTQVTSVFQPFPWQVAPWRYQGPVMLLTGSAGGGKSQLAAEKVHGFLKRYAGSTALLLRKAREYTSKSIAPMMQSAIGLDDSVIYKRSDGLFEYANGSIAYMAGMKDTLQREALRSMRGKYGEPDIAWMEEANAFTRLDYDEVSARIRGDVAGWTQLILSTNPDIPQHWIYTDLILGNGAKTFYSTAHDNPRNTKAYFERLDGLVGVLRERLRDGKWVRAEGAVYDEFDPESNLIDWFQPPDSWRRFRTIDFGYTNPFVCQWWAVDPDGRMYLYQEMVRTKSLVEDLTPEITAMSRGRNEATIADHDAEDRATMEKHGIPTVPALKDVQSGIQAVKKRLKKAGDGKPRLFIMRGALLERDPNYDGPQGLQEEIGAYAWQKYQDGKPNKEEPAKMFDHSCDPCRYGVMFIDSVSPVPQRQSDARSRWAPVAPKRDRSWDEEEDGTGTERSRWNPLHEKRR